MMMKRLISLLLSLLLTVSLCAAETLPDMEGMLTEEGLRLRRCTAPDGQDILYTAECEEEYVYAEDVNFDGVDDLVALTMLGASNAAYTFFLATDQGYQPVMTDEPLYNYSLDAERRLVLTNLDGGWSEAVYCAYTWEDGTLRLIRRAEMTLSETMEDRLMMRVTDLRGEEPLTIWEDHVPILAETAVAYAFSEMVNKLTEGLPVIELE